VTVWECNACAIPCRLDDNDEKTSLTGDPVACPFRPHRIDKTPRWREVVE